MVTHGFGMGLVPAMLPRISRSTGSGYDALGLAVAATMFAYSLGAALTPRVAARFGLRELLMGTYALSGIGFLLVASVRSAPVLALCVLTLGLSAPLNWASTLQSAGRVADASRRGLVMSVASSGAGIGAALNGFFIWSLTGTENWRLAFLIAAGCAAAATAAVPIMIRRPLPPVGAPPARSGSLRAVWGSATGRMVIVASVSTAVTGFAMGAYMTVAAVEELAAGPLAAAALWWLIGLTLLAASAPIGALADRAGPARAIVTTVSIYTAALLAAANFWSYAALAAMAACYAAFHYPVWGLLGLAADREMPPPLALRAVTLGLTAGAATGGITVALIGAWFDRIGTLRPVVSLLATWALAFTFWMAYRHRKASAPAGPEPGDLKPDG